MENEERLEEHIRLTPVTVLEEFARFYKFVHEVILPFEPKGFKAHSAFHRQLMYAACQDLSVTAAPRGHLKSSLFSRYRALHRLVDPAPALLPEGVAVEVLLLSETETLSMEHLNWIKEQLMKNPVLIERYGELKPDETERMAWSNDELELTNGNRAYALGYRSQIRSRHPTDIFVDDLESEKNLTSPEMVKKLKDWFYRVLMGAMIPETRLAVIGTIIVKDSLLDELLGKPEFAGKLWKALGCQDEVMTSLWPERWPVELLLKRKALLGTHRFNAEYQNEPLGLGDAIILEEWVRRHTDQDLASQTILARYMTVDVAVTEEKWGNHSAIIVMDEVGDGRLMERLAWKRRVSFPDLIKTIMDFYYHFSSNCPRMFLGVEEVAQQKAVRQSINEKDPDILVIPMKADKDKVRRLVAVSRYFEMGMVSLKTESFIEEVLNFPMGEKDRCFVAGTMIATTRGAVPIEKIKQGDNVLSPFGTATVCGVSELEVSSEEMITKYGLTATKDHKILTFSDGFVSLQSASDDISRLTFRELLIWRCLKELNLTDGAIRSLGRSDIISELRNHLRLKEGRISRDFMLMFGKFITEKKFRKAFSFIIKTATALITTLKIWSVYLASNMRRYIGSRLVNGVWITWLLSEKKRMNGTGRTLDGNGIGNMPQKFGKILKNILDFVNNAVTNLNHFIAAQNFAAGFVPKKFGWMPIKLNFNATIADQNSDHGKDTGNNGFPRHVLHHAGPDFSIKVYDLKVSHGVMYANGVLVSNCDALAHNLHLYEMQHPVLLDGSQTELDPLTKVSHDNLELYIERAMNGVPDHPLPAKYETLYLEAQEISEMMDENME